MRVIRNHIEPLPEQEAVDIHLNSARPLRKHRRDQHLNPIQFLNLVLRHIFALQISIDRHLN
jgi:hypothetical protein